MAQQIAFSGGLGGIRANDVSDSTTYGQEEQLGTLVFGANGVVLMYVQAAATIGLNNAICINAQMQAVNLTQALVQAGQLVGAVPDLLPTVTSITSGQYFWAVVKGVVNINCLTGSTSSVSAVYTSASAGAVNTASGGNSQIRGIVFTASSSSPGATASLPAVLNFPQYYSF